MGNEKLVDSFVCVSVFKVFRRNGDVLGSLLQDSEKCPITVYQKCVEITSKFGPFMVFHNQKTACAFRAALSTSARFELFGKQEYLEVWECKTFLEYLCHSHDFIINFGSLQHEPRDYIETNLEAFWSIKWLSDYHSHQLSAAPSGTCYCTKLTPICPCA